MKRCRKCGNEYPLSFEYFRHATSSQDGFQPWCRLCQDEYDRIWRAENKERYRETSRKWAERNKEKKLEYNKEWRKKNPEKQLEYSRKSRAKNPERANEATRLWNKKNREHHRKYASEYRSKNPGFHISQVIGTAIWHSLRGGKHGRSWESLVGYTLGDLMAHLESQFTKGMNWDNYGEWHIDHIRPISDFNFVDTEDSDFRECWSLWNLRPLWGKENLAKGSECKEPPLPLRHS